MRCQRALWSFSLAACRRFTLHAWRSPTRLFADQTAELLIFFCHAGSTAWRTPIFSGNAAGKETRPPSSTQRTPRVAHHRRLSPPNPAPRAAPAPAPAKLVALPARLRAMLAARRSPSPSPSLKLRFLPSHGPETARPTQATLAPTACTRRRPRAAVRAAGTASEVGISSSPTCGCAPGAGCG